MVAHMRGDGFGGGGRFGGGRVGGGGFFSGGGRGLGGRGAAGVARCWGRGLPGGGGRRLCMKRCRIGNCQGSSGALSPPSAEVCCKPRLWPWNGDPPCLQGVHGRHGALLGEMAQGGSACAGAAKTAWVGRLAAEPRNTRCPEQP